MSAPVLEDAAYRRGLVLGLTMAEMVILLLFIILLVLASLLQTERDKEEEAKKKYVELLVEKNHLEQEMDLLKEKYEKLAEMVSGQDSFDELFRELELVREKLKAANKRLKAAEELSTKLWGDGLKKGDIRAIKAIAERIQEWKTVASRKGVPIEQVIWQESALIRNAETRISDLEGRIKNIQRRIVTFGKGTEKPSCWANPRTGRTEYIFDVALTSSGLVIRDRYLPHREKAKKKLPIKNIKFEKELTPNEFIRQTRSLFEWSEKNNCRFFVRAFDMTGPHEKKTYKERMRTLEQHFYKLEVIGREF